MTVSRAPCGIGPWSHFRTNFGAFLNRFSVHFWTNFWLGFDSVFGVILVRVLVKIWFGFLAGIGWKTLQHFIRNVWPVGSILGGDLSRVSYDKGVNKFHECAEGFWNNSGNFLKLIPVGIRFKNSTKPKPKLQQNTNQFWTKIGIKNIWKPGPRMKQNWIGTGSGLARPLGAREMVMFWWSWFFENSNFYYTSVIHLH